MNRQLRRKLERESAKEREKELERAAKEFDKDVKKNGTFDARKVLGNEAYMQQFIQKRVKECEGYARNGITAEDLENKYKAGYAAARMDINEFVGNFYSAALAISLHRLYGFGANRIFRVLEDMTQVMLEEISVEEIAVRLKQETGLDMEDVHETIRG